MDETGRSLTPTHPFLSSFYYFAAWRVVATGYPPPTNMVGWYMFCWCLSTRHSVYSSRYYTHYHSSYLYLSENGGVRTAAPRPAFRTQQSEWLFFRIPFFMGAASPYNRNAFTSLLVWAIIWKRAVYLSFSSSSFFTLSFVSMYRDISLEIIETSITRPIVGRIVFTLPSSSRLAIIRLIGYAGAVT
jgi:hypothetical protein